MTTIAQRWMIRLGLGLGALVLLAILTLSLAPVSTALADTLRGLPRLTIDLGALTHPPRAAAAEQAPAVQTATAPAPTPASAAGPSSDAMTLKRVLQVEGPFRHGDYVWDEEGVPPGEVVITVDTKAQTIAVFRGGYQIGAAVVLYGADDYPTPLGTFRISQKDKDHRSNVYNNAPMPYMLRLTNDGVAIHASDVAWGNATHGCVGVPLAFARLLFAQAKIGTTVIVTAGKMMAVPQGTQMAQAGIVR